MIFIAFASAAAAYGNLPQTADLKEMREALRDELDLQAQQSMAYWTRWTFFLTAAGFGVSTLALVGLFRSLAQTREALTHGFLENRPWISISDIVFENSFICDRVEDTMGGISFIPHPDGNCLSLYGSFLIKNTGNSPAFNLRYGFQFGNFDRDNRIMPGSSSIGSFLGILPPGETKRMTIIYDIGLVAADDPNDIGTITATFDVSYEPYKTKKHLHTVLTAFLVESQPAKHKAKNYAPMALRRDRFQSPDFPGIGLNGENLARFD